jgi:hypothetical protein
MSLPSSARNQHQTGSKEIDLLDSFFMLSMKMEAISSSKTPVDFQRMTRIYIPEHIPFHNHRRENLKSYH